MSHKELVQDKRIKRTKKLLKDSLLVLLEIKSLKEITITDIVQKAEVNRGTFYKHYQYKEDLLEELIDDVLYDLTQSYQEPYRNLETFDIKNLTASAIKIFQHVYLYKKFYEIIIKYNVLPGYQEKICNVIKKLTIQDFLDYRENNHINTDMYASYHAYAILGMII
ncbi:MAG TPA: TetR/AcrR family transcriptional regulator, partial [Paenibacillaceae bacterium]|nr:TetR/AcrR family transcriptional regulator [Paenibacillaceae bacterium]